MAPVWDRLGEIDVPVLLVAGGLDRPYVGAHARMAALLPRGRAVTVAGAGHAPQLERPDEVAALIADL
jgi:pimeloyl-ACP methyl ester carboxylesterase